VCALDSLVFVGDRVGLAALSEKYDPIKKKIESAPAEAKLEISSYIIFPTAQKSPRTIPGPLKRSNHHRIVGSRHYRRAPQPVTNQQNRLPGSLDRMKRRKGRKTYRLLPSEEVR